MSDGFLGRWSRRKQEVREGKAAHEPVRTEPPPVPPPQPSPGGGGSLQSPPPLGEGEGGGHVSKSPPPTLEHAQSLTPESDFRRFVAADVPAEVRNTALRKLFADPRFNVQDGLDVYIDDYSKPDPLPASMARKLASAQFLNLFEEKKEDSREVADDPTGQTVAQSGAADEAVPPLQDADPDLRLQQDHAPGPAGPGQGTE